MMKFIVFLTLVVSGTAFAGESGGYRARGPLKCSYLKSCGEGNICENPQDECFVLNACDKAVCLQAEQACLMDCGTSKCNIMESFPQQVSCN